MVVSGGGGGGRRQRGVEQRHCVDPVPAPAPEAEAKAGAFGERDVGVEGEEAEGIRSEEDWARGAGSLSMQLLLPAARPVAFAIPFGVSQLSSPTRQGITLSESAVSSNRAPWPAGAGGSMDAGWPQKMTKKKSGEMVHWLVWFTGSGVSQSDEKRREAERASGRCSVKCLDSSSFDFLVSTAIIR